MLARFGRAERARRRRPRPRSGTRSATSTLLGARRARRVWRVSVKPSDGPTVADAVRRGASTAASSTTGAAASSGSPAATGRDAGAAVVRARGRGRRRPRRRWSARPTTSALADRVFEPPAAAADGADPQAEGRLRPGRHSQSRPHVCRAFDDADQLHPRPACRSGHRGVGEDPALLRALRVLHGDLPDLCAARRRARQPARPHLPDQGHAGERQAGERGGRRSTSTAACPASPA